MTEPRPPAGRALARAEHGEAALAVHRHEDVAVIALQRPERRNALDRVTVDELTARFHELGHDGTRAIVLHGTGGHFCAGADLATVFDEGFTDALARLLTTITEAEAVTIAAIEGFALGGGVQLAVACDLRVADPEARFGVPAGRLGLTVDRWTAARVVALAGGGPARAMLLGGEQLTGADAHRFGFVQRLGGFDQALAWAHEVAALAPLTLQAHKAFLEGRPDGEARRATAWQSEDLQEGIAAFQARRPARFQGR